MARKMSKVVYLRSCKGDGRKSRSRGATRTKQDTMGRGVAEIYSNTIQQYSNPKEKFIVMTGTNNEGIIGVGGIVSPRSL